MQKMQRMQKMHKFNDIGANGGELSATVVATFVEKCKRKRTATLGSTGREREVIPDICHQISGVGGGGGGLLRIRNFCFSEDFS